MLIFIACFFLFGSALTLVFLKLLQPGSRFTWLIAIGGGIFGLLSVLAWQIQMPFSLNLLHWEPQGIFSTPVSFQADGFTWALALGLIALTTTILITAIARPGPTSSFTWAGTLVLGGLGLLAVTANNPLTLILVWGALDLLELFVQLRVVNGPEQNEKVVIAFSARAVGIGVLIWGIVIDLASGGALEFSSITPASGLYFVLAAGLRLGVFPLHLPFSPEPSVRRGFGTSLRLVSAASSLILLMHVPAESLVSAWSSILSLLVVIAALYGSWMWLRAPDEMIGRPQWMIATAALAVLASLQGNQSGSIAWACGMVLSGGALFLSSLHHKWMNRALLLCAFSLSSLPFSLTASTWMPSAGIFTPFGILSQSMLLAGFVRHTFRPGNKEPLEAQPNWIRTVYPTGILLMLMVQVILGLVGWKGASQVGNLLFAIPGAVITLALIWFAPRIRMLNPPRAHWASPAPMQGMTVYGILWTLYRGLRRLTNIVVAVMEGQGGVMWTLLFLVLFISLMVQGGS
jgi:hypothetical protein